MRVAIYSPYLDSLGGGEKYMMTIAEVLSAKDLVDVLLDEHLNSLGQENLRDNFSKRFNLDLSKVRFTKAPLGTNSSFLKRIFFLMKYNLLIYLTDGSIFYPTVKKSILHIQSPLRGQPATSLWGRLKLKGWDLIIYNSKFTQKWSEDNWPLASRIIYPPVDVDKIKPLKKKNYILSVGRFFGYLKDKKHALLIKVFSDLYNNQSIKEWSLHLVGSAGEGDRPYLKELKDLAKDLPINFYPNLGYDDLIRLYGQSSIYWHAAGFREENPTKMEHFGIATVEAMAGGCVPVVIGKGGQVEIVEHGKSGFVWETLDELEEYTLKLIKKEEILEDMSKDSVMRSKIFSKEKFRQKIIQLLR